MASTPGRLSKALFEMTPDDILGRNDGGSPGVAGIQPLHGIGNYCTYPAHLILNGNRRSKWEQKSHDQRPDLRSQAQRYGCGANSDRKTENRSSVPTYPAHLIPDSVNKKPVSPTLTSPPPPKEQSNLMFEDLLEDFIFQSTTYGSQYDITDYSSNHIPEQPVYKDKSSNISDSLKPSPGGESFWLTPCLSDTSSVSDIYDQSPLVAHTTSAVSDEINGFDLFGDTHLPSPQTINGEHFVNPAQTKSTEYLLSVKTGNKRKRGQSVSIDIEAKKYKCYLCNYEGTHTGNFNRHTKTHDIVRESVACSMCGRPYSTKFNLGRHVCRQND
ncbi:hypothetical protein CLU79DRAFT_717031 [Phycomyces nitens]|nr:hypothetical protein CLU79DRAFT_717031 [Phycomyces nitens]